MKLAKWVPKQWMWGKSHRDRVPMALKVKRKRWVFNSFWDGLAIQFPSYWRTTWFNMTMNPLVWLNIHIWCTLKWIIKVRGQKRCVTVHDDITGNQVVKFSLFLLHSSLLILHYQVQQIHFYTPHKSLKSIDTNKFIKLNTFFVKFITNV